jgi:hypothetical protein
LRNPHTETTARISTIWFSLQCLRRSANISSVTPRGTDAAAIAKSRAMRSPCEKSGRVRNSRTAESRYPSTQRAGGVLSAYDISMRLHAATR